MIRPAIFFGHVASLEARKAMSYRADFWINVLVSFFAQFGVMWFLWTSIYQTTGASAIGGFTLAEILRYSILAILIGKLVRGVEMQAGVAQDIYDGGLSRYLLYPVSYWAFKYAQHVGALLPALLQLGIFLLLLPLAPGGVGDWHPTLAHAGMAASALVVANLLYFLMALPLQGVAFWADNVWSLAVLLRFVSGILGGSQLPLDLFPAQARLVLDWLPFRALFDFPVSALLGRLDATQWTRGMAISLGWCGLLWLLSKGVWRKGERGYTGVGI